MARFRNDTGSVLTVNDLMLQAGPGEEFDWPGHDPEVHGPVPGCARLDEPANRKKAGKAAATDTEAGE